MSARRISSSCNCCFMRVPKNRLSLLLLLGHLPSQIWIHRLKKSWLMQLHNCALEKLWDQERQKRIHKPQMDESHNKLGILQPPGSSRTALESPGSQVRCNLDRPCVWRRRTAGGHYNFPVLADDSLHGSHTSAPRLTSHFILHRRHSLLLTMPPTMRIRETIFLESL